MAEFLAANPIIDCSKHEVLIPIRIEFKSGEVTVTVPEWYVEEVKPNFKCEIYAKDNRNNLCGNRCRGVVSRIVVMHEGRQPGHVATDRLC